MQAGYKRSITSLYRMLIKFGIYNKVPLKKKIWAKIVSTHKISMRKSTSRCKICTKGMYEKRIDRKKWKFNNSIISISTLVVSRKCDICLTNLHT